MINGQSPALIFVHDGKSRAGHRGRALQSCDEPLREQGLTAAEFAFERQHGTGHEMFRDLPRDCFGFSWAVGNERSHEAICDLCLETPAVVSHPLGVICHGASQYELAAVWGIFDAIRVLTELSRAGKWQRAVRSLRLLKSRCRWLHQKLPAIFLARRRIPPCSSAQVEEDRLRVRRLNPS